MHDMQEKWNDTHPGMAHFAHTGPSGKSCRECSNCVTYGRYAKTNTKQAKKLKPARCAEYAHRMMCAILKSPTFPAKAGACNVFDQNDTPPPVRGE